MRPLLAGVCAWIACCALATGAAAHQGNPNFRSQINAIDPADAGLEADVLNYDDEIQLFNKGSEDVLVFGYENEPYVRISADGTVAVNRRSPAYYLNDDRYAEGEVPAVADAEARPEWELVDRTGQYSWHDHRAHYMSRDTPPQVKDESVETKVFDYSVPIEVGGKPGSLDGTLRWVGTGSDGTPIAPFIGLGLVALVGMPLAVLWRRRRDQGGGDDADRAAARKEAW